MSDSISRRKFLTATATGLCVPAFLRGDESKTKDETVAFFLVGDTHFLANKEDIAKLDERSEAVLSRVLGLLIANIAYGRMVPQPIF